MDLSIIIPLYNEEDSLADLYNQLLAVLNTLQLNYEIWFIDDGSVDNSLKILENYRSENQRIKILPSPEKSKKEGLHILTQQNF